MTQIEILFFQAVALATISLWLEGLSKNKLTKSSYQWPCAILHHDIWYLLSLVTESNPWWGWLFDCSMLLHNVLKDFLYQAEVWHRDFTVWSCAKNYNASMVLNWLLHKWCLLHGTWSILVILNFLQSKFLVPGKVGIFALK